MTNPRVTVLTNERDFAADDVIRRLLAAGVDVARHNVEAVRAQGIAATCITSELGHAHGSAIWWRQFELERRVASLVEADDLLVERAQWRAWLAVLARSENIWVNDLWAARRAENKIEQLRCAIALGADVPQTLITNDRGDAQAYTAAVGPCVVKALSAGYFELSDQSFVFTTDLDAALDESADAMWTQQPLIVQRKVSRSLDVRVVSFNGKHFGASCRSGETDWRRQASEVTWEPWRVPMNIAKFCDRYLDAMDLRFAAFDFAIDHDGRAWFLEANQAGEWQFLDRPLKLGIADALAGFLAALAAECS